MNVKNLKIGDSIQYQLPLFDPQEGKITKIYTDSVVINNNNHVSEKYIIKKVNKDKISLDDLKIGDRVKYKDKIAYCGTTTFEEVEREGHIYGIYDNFYRISDNYNRFNNKELFVKKERIVSKLECLPPQYKEIPIEKETHFWTKRVYHCEYATTPTYKECKEKQRSDELFKKMEECDKSFTKAARDINNFIDKNKEKPAPKSFKFDIWPVKLEGTMNKYTQKFNYSMSGHDEYRKDFYDLPCPDWIEWGKTYTIEIKEKE